MGMGMAINSRFHRLRRTLSNILLPPFPPPRPPRAHILPPPPPTAQTNPFPQNAPPESVHAGHHAAHHRRRIDWSAREVWFTVTRRTGQAGETCGGERGRGKQGVCEEWWDGGVGGVGGDGGDDGWVGGGDEYG